MAQEPAPLGIHSSARCQEMGFTVTHRSAQGAALVLASASRKDHQAQTKLLPIIRCRQHIKMARIK